MHTLSASGWFSREVINLVNGMDVGAVSEELLHSSCPSCPAAEVQGCPAIVICTVDRNAVQELDQLLYVAYRCGLQHETALLSSHLLELTLPVRATKGKLTDPLASATNSSDHV